MCQQHETVMMNFISLRSTKENAIYSRGFFPRD